MNYCDNKRLLIKLVFLVPFFLILVLCEICVCQSKMEDNGVPIMELSTSIEITPYTMKLIREVEDITNLKILLKRLPETTEEKLGNETVSFGYPMIGAYYDNGIPTIGYRYSNIKDATAYAICHEVWHLLLKSMSQIYEIGYASPLYDALMKRMQREAKCKEVFDHAMTVLHHSFFFDDILAEGFSLKETYERFTDIKNVCNNYEKESQFYNIAIDVWHLKLGVDDLTTNNKSHLFYIKRKFPKEYTIGVRLYAISRDFNEASEEPEIAKRILRTLLSYKEPINFTKYDKYENTLNLGIYH